ncbi:MAG: O-antigen ligase family protein, partial [Phycisphaerales bacterium]
TCLLIIFSPQFDLVSGRLGIRLAAGDRTNPLAIGTMGGTLMVVGALTLFSTRNTLGIVYRGSAIVLGAGVGILSGSRGQVVFAALTILLCIPLSYRLANARGFLLTVLSGLGVVGGLYFAASRFIGSDNEDRWRLDELAAGGSGRVDNVLELLTAYVESPAHWVQGLGFTAFGTLNTRSGDPYSHVMTVDALAEGGLIGAALLAWIVLTGFRNGRAISRAVSELPAERAFASVLLGLSLYHFLLANKQGSMLGTPILFGLLILMGRIRNDLDRREPIWADEEVPEEFEHETQRVAVAGGA